MKFEQMIQSIMVGQNLQRTYTVGEEFGSRIVNRIDNQSTEFEDHIHSEFLVFDEDDNLIIQIENMPVLVEFKMIVVDGPAEQPSLTNK